MVLPSFFHLCRCNAYFKKSNVQIPWYMERSNKLPSSVALTLLKYYEIFTGILTCKFLALFAFLERIMFLYKVPARTAKYEEVKRGHTSSRLLKCGFVFILFPRFWSPTVWACSALLVEVLTLLGLAGLFHTASRPSWLQAM